MNPNLKLVQQMFSKEQQLRSFLTKLQTELYRINVNYTDGKLKKILKEFPMSIEKFKTLLPNVLPVEKQNEIYKMFQKDAYLTKM